MQTDRLPPQFHPAPIVRSGRSIAGVSVVMPRVAVQQNSRIDGDSLTGHVPQPNFVSTWRKSFIGRKRISILDEILVRHICGLLFSQRPSGLPDGRGQSRRSWIIRTCGLRRSQFYRLIRGALGRLAMHCQARGAVSRVVRPNKESRVSSSSANSRAMLFEPPPSAGRRRKSPSVSS